MARITLITGANRGIGREVALQLWGRGDVVYAGARDPGTALPTGHEDHERWRWCTLDVTSDEQVKAIAQRIDAEEGHLDVLINNAAIMDREPLTDGDTESLRKTMEVNFYGPMRMNAALRPLLERSADARIINVTSEMGAFDSLLGRYAGYRLSKAGLNAQTVLLANELSDRGIKVNAVCPGWVRTDMGGSRAPGSVGDGADSIVWTATVEDCPNGQFIYHRRSRSW